MKKKWQNPIFDVKRLENNIEEASSFASSVNSSQFLSSQWYVTSAQCAHAPWAVSEWPLMCGTEDMCCSLWWRGPLGSEFCDDDGVTPGVVRCDEPSDMCRRWSLPGCEIKSINPSNQSVHGNLNKSVLQTNINLRKREFHEDLK